MELVNATWPSLNTDGGRFELLRDAGSVMGSTLLEATGIIDADKIWDWRY